MRDCLVSLQKEIPELERAYFKQDNTGCYHSCRGNSVVSAKLRALPKATFKKKIKMILLNILENEDSYKDLESIISKANFYSSELFILIFPSCFVSDSSHLLCSLIELMYEFLLSSYSFAFSFSITQRLPDFISFYLPGPPRLAPAT